MKKLLLYLFPILTVIFIAFMIGLFFGRQNATAVYLQPAQDVAATDAQQQAVVDGKININTANASQLTYIPGIGDVMAQRIIEYREANGDFASIDDLYNIEGFGPKKVEQVAPYITTGGSE